MQPPSRWTRRACRSAILIEPRADLPQAITLGVDKAYAIEDFVNELRSTKVTPHVAQDGARRRSMAA